MKKIITLVFYLCFNQFAFAQINKPLIVILDSIYTKDQKCREQVDSIINKFGLQSKEMHSIIVEMNKVDSINLVIVKDILDKYGWLGEDKIGKQGNHTLFLVIQHSDQTTQEKFLPMIRNAVKNGNAKLSDLALLEDRVLLGQGKMQIYGTQISMDNQTQLYFVSPLEDPDNVDKRRKEVGLSSMTEYTKQWQIDWNITQYKKDLPKLIELEKLEIK